MYLTKGILYEPGCGIEPEEACKKFGKNDIPRVPVTDMSHFMEDDIPSVIFHILTVYDDTAHPAVRPRTAVIRHIKTNIPAASAFFSTAAENTVVFMCPGSPFNPDIQSDKRYCVPNGYNGRACDINVSQYGEPVRSRMHLFRP